MRAEVESAPLILMISVINDDDVRQQVLEGADDFLVKLYLSTDVFGFCQVGLWV